MAIVYEARVYEKQISYKNFKGEQKESTIFFSFDPMALMSVLSAYQPKKIKSGNPALNGKDADMTDEDQIKMVRSLAIKAAGTPSDDGEFWIPFERFDESLVGKAWLTMLVTSDEVRREFSDTVLLEPFRAFCGFFNEDPDNSEKDKKEMKDMLAKMERLFKTPAPTDESLADKRARLLAELAATPES